MPECKKIGAVRCHLLQYKRTLLPNIAIVSPCPIVKKGGICSCAYCHFSLISGTWKKAGGLPKSSACPKFPKWMTPTRATLLLGCPTQNWKEYFFLNQSPFVIWVSYQLGYCTSLKSHCALHRNFCSKLFSETKRDMSFLLRSRSSSQYKAGAACSLSDIPVHSGSCRSIQGPFRFIQVHPGSLGSIQVRVTGSPRFTQVH